MPHHAITKDAKTKSPTKGCVIGMGQGPGAVMRDARTLPRREEFVCGTEQRGIEKSAVKKDAPTKPAAEECATDMEEGQRAPMKDVSH